MKKLIAFILAFCMLTTLVACDNQTPALETTNTEVALPKQIAIISNDSVNYENLSGDNEVRKAESSTIVESENSDQSYEINLEGITSLEELEARIEEHLDKCIGALYSKWEKLSTKTDTYEKYCKNAVEVSDFYQLIKDDTERMCIMLKEYSAAYARLILDSDMTDKKKYRAIDGIKDEIYDDACDEIYDEIYEGILDDMHDYYYEGVLDKTPSNVDYSDWYETVSKEYRQWYDTCSDVYSLYYDTASDIYSFYYDMSSILYSGDIDRAEKRYDRFNKKNVNDKNPNVGNSDSNATFDTSLRPVENIDEFDQVIETHVSECVRALWEEWATLSTDIDSYDEYISNIDTIEEFHTHISDAASDILSMISEYGVLYAGLVLRSNQTTKNMYNVFEDFKDIVYEDACKIVKDEIYEDLLKEIKEYYYEGIISDAKDNAKYSEWSNARQDAYSWWSDARKQVYNNWSDTRRDLYGFYTDIRRELYGGNLDGANDELESFIQKVEKKK